MSSKESSLEDTKAKFSDVDNLDKLLETLRTDLVSFIEQLNNI